MVFSGIDYDKINWDDPDDPELQRLHKKRTEFIERISTNDGLKEFINMVRVI